MTSRSCRHEGDQTVYWEGREAARGCAHAYVGAARVVTPLMLGAHTAYFRQMQSRGRTNCDVFVARIGMLHILVIRKAECGKRGKQSREHEDTSGTGKCPIQEVGGAGD